MSDEQDPEKKIFIDEDWKSQVEAEKEAASRQPESADDAQAESPAGPLPPPDLTFLSSSLYLQGMISLGLLPNPATDKPEPHLPQARHTIDMLQMLQEKTEGNRTPEETEEFDRILHELRMAYVAVQQKGNAE